MIIALHTADLGLEALYTVLTCSVEVTFRASTVRNTANNLGVEFHHLNVALFLHRVKHVQECGTQNVLCS